MFSYKAAQLVKKKCQKHCQKCQKRSGKNTKTLCPKYRERKATNVKKKKVRNMDIFKLPKPSMADKGWEKFEVGKNLKFKKR